MTGAQDLGSSRPDRAISGRVLALLRASSRPLDDDEIARRLDVHPRQRVNSVCRRLDREGLLRRRPGPEGKLVNEILIDPAPGQGTAPAEGSGEAIAGADRGRPRGTEPGASGTAGDTSSGQLGELPPGDSGEQRQAEGIMLAALSRELGIALQPRRIPVGAVRVEVDGADEDHAVLVEAWAHQGPPKAAQRHKVLADALKLVWVASTLPARPRLVLCLSDPAAAAPFTGSRSWAGAALHDLGVEVRLVDLPDEVRALVLRAQRRQYR